MSHNSNYISLEIRRNVSQFAAQLTFLTQEVAAYSLQMVHPLVLVASKNWSYAPE